MPPLETCLEEAVLKLEIPKHTALRHTKSSSTPSTPEMHLRRALSLRSGTASKIACVKYCFSPHFGYFPSPNQTKIECFCLQPKIHSVFGSLTVFSSIQGQKVLMLQSNCARFHLEAVQTVLDQLYLSTLQCDYGILTCQTNCTKEPNRPGLDSNVLHISMLESS